MDIVFQEIQQWQLFKITDYFRKRQLPGYYQMVLKFHEGGVSLLDITGYQMIREIKTLSRDDIQFYRDTLFRKSHYAYQVGFKDTVIVVGFWADDYPLLGEILKEKLPDDPRSTFDTDRDSGGRIFLDFNPTT